MNILKKITSSGFCSSLSQVLREIKILFKHKSGLRRSSIYADQRHLKLHIGCGPKLKHGWVNIDLDPQADLTLDLREPLPFADASCSIIYSEHFLEHLEYPKYALSFLKECFRALEPRGIFNVGVPDTEWPLQEYASKKTDGYFQFVKAHWHPFWCHTEMEHINFHFRQGDQHRFAYDFDTLAYALSSVGFRDVKRRDFDPDLDSEDRKAGTLYVVASKPMDD